MIIDRDDLVFDFDCPDCITRYKEVKPQNFVLLASVFSYAVGFECKACGCKFRFETTKEKMRMLLHELKRINRIE